MEDYKLNRKKSRNVFLLGWAIVTIVVIMMSFIFLNSLENTVDDETKRYLSEISHHVASMINSRVSYTHQNLSSIADTYTQLEDGQIDTFLKSKLSRYNYKDIGIVDANGQCQLILGGTVDLSDYPVIMNALDGYSSVSNLILSPVDDTEIIIYAVPIFNDGELKGALMASTDKDSFVEYLSVESFGGEGFSHIIDYSGNFIVKSSNKNSYVGNINFFRYIEDNGRVLPGFSFDKMISDMNEDKSGILYYELNGKDSKVLNYISLNVPDWYLLSVVPTKIISDKTSVFIKDTIIINIIIVIMFIILFSIIMYMQNKNQKHLSYIAYTDPVTGGFNQSRFIHEVKKVIANYPPGSFALVSIDIEKFKLINDSFGSEAGNNTLKHVHNTIIKYLGQNEFTARISADKFNILMRYTSDDDVLKRLDDIINDINGYNQNLNQKYYLPISGGVYVIDEPDLNIITIQDRANVARKNNKKSHIAHLNSCVFYSDVERLRMIREKEIDNKMESSLENNEFIVYLQPQYSISTNKISRAEALVRWQDPDSGLIPPNEFIPVFEKNSFIIKLDLYVFDKVCQMIQNWIHLGYTPIPISVNVSGVHLRNPDFLEDFKLIYNKYDFPAQLIELEFTETLVFENLSVLKRVIDQMYEIGFSCALDDFGSGYSSLNTLKDVPVDVLKLDRAFFSGNIDSDLRGKHVIENIINLSQKLNMKTVAEGVESISQVEFLRESKCDMIQGYVFSKPIPVAEFEELAFKDSNN